MKVSIIICDRYKSCAGGKCFRALQNREGAFDIYSKKEALDIVGYTSCGGCPGGNVEYSPAEMKKNGADVIHLATGLLVGYPPCPRIRQFTEFIKTAYRLDVISGTHPIPQNYYLRHQELDTWNSVWWKNTIRHVLSDEKTRLRYD